MKYKVISLKTSEGKLTYGIRYGKTVISDISNSISHVRRLVKKMNKYRVPLVHFRDVVSDNLN